ncbi:MAG: hypothetical protein R3F65_18860 [bacterium]|nr:hypothetical protein [Myxococcales bacterium]
MRGLALWVALWVALWGCGAPGGRSAAGDVTHAMDDTGAIGGAGAVDAMDAMGDAGAIDMDAMDGIASEPGGERAAPEADPAPVASLTLAVAVVSGATAEPVLRPVIFELRDALAACRPRDAAAPREVVMEVVVEPFRGQARAWMSAPDKRTLTVAQWAAAAPVGRCLADVLGGSRWPRPGDGMPASFAVTLRWQG